MKTQQQWAVYLKGILKAELSRRNINYHTLALSLKDLGIVETPENLTNKINRGKFSAIFMVRCLEAIGCKTLRLGDE